MKRIWPFNRKPKQIQNSYIGEVSMDRAIDLMSQETGFVGVRSGAGKVVTDQTAMQFSAVYACVSLLAGTLASLPFEIKRDIGGGESEIDKAHPAYKLINSAPNSVLSAYVQWETIFSEHFLNGNGYGVIDRYPNGDPSGIYWAPQRAVYPYLNIDKSRIWYRVSFGTTATNKKSETRVFDQDDILHFPCIGWDGLKGMSPLWAARESIGLGLAGQSFNSDYFTNAISSNMAISYPKGLSEPAKKQLKEYLLERANGGKSARAPLVLTDDGRVTSLQMNADDAQMMASRIFQIEDICRFYGVPLHLVSSTDKSTSWGTGIEQQTIGFIMFSLRKRLKMIEQEIDRKLINSDTHFCKINLTSLLRGDATARANYYNVMRGGNQLPGVMSTNEIRKVEGLPRIDKSEYDLPYQPAPAAPGKVDLNANTEPDKPA